jgi:hypothetical protein
LQVKSQETLIVDCAGGTGLETPAVDYVGGTDLGSTPIVDGTDLGSRAGRRWLRSLQCWSQETVIGIMILETRVGSWITMLEILVGSTMLEALIWGRE